MIYRGREIQCSLFAEDDMMLLLLLSVYQDIPGRPHTVKTSLPDWCVHGGIEAQLHVLTFGVAFDLDPHVYVVTRVVTRTRHAIALSIGPITGLHDVFYRQDMLFHSSILRQFDFLVNQYVLHGIYQPRESIAPVGVSASVHFFQEGPQFHDFRRIHTWVRTLLGNPI